IRRRFFERPGERRQWPATSPANNVVFREHGLHFVPERARLTQTALVRCGFAYQVQAPARASAGGVEEVTVTRNLVRTSQSCPRARSNPAALRRAASPLRAHGCPAARARPPAGPRAHKPRAT